MNPYVIRFIIANVALMIVLAIVAEILELKSGSGLAVGSALASSFFAAGAFAKDHSREPSSAEKGAFAWRALLATWLVSLVLTGIALAIFSNASEVRSVGGFLRSGSNLALVGGTLLFVSAIYYVGIRWSFGWYARLAAARKR